MDKEKYDKQITDTKSYLNSALYLLNWEQESPKYVDEARQRLLWAIDSLSEAYYERTGEELSEVHW